MKILLILNEAPYGSEKVYNVLRLAMKLQQEHAEAEIRVFLMADAVTAALPDQTTPQGVLQRRTDAQSGDQQRRGSQSMRHLCRGSRAGQGAPDRRHRGQHDGPAGPMGRGLGQSAHVLSGRVLRLASGGADLVATLAARKHTEWDQGPISCGAFERRAHELHPAVEHVEHTGTETRHPQTNGICAGARLLRLLGDCRQ